MVILLEKINSFYYECKKVEYKNFCVRVYNNDLILGIAILNFSLSWVNDYFLNWGIAIPQFNK
jgi:hypothetical protein